MTMEMKNLEEILAGKNFLADRQQSQQKMSGCLLMLMQTFLVDVKLHTTQKKTSNRNIPESESSSCDAKSLC